MKLRYKVILFAITPVIVSLCALALFVQHQAVNLARQQRATIQQAYLAGKEAELRHYVGLASRSVAHLYESGRVDARAREEAKRILASLSYGSDGYFFVYDMQGRNLMHPRQPELVGRNLWEMRDVRDLCGGRDSARTAEKPVSFDATACADSGAIGLPVSANAPRFSAMWDSDPSTAQAPGGIPIIQRLIARARTGGGFERYVWVKPSSNRLAPKLGYVVAMPRWGWMMGTGIYLDDVEAALAKIDAQQSRHIRSTMWVIVALAVLSALLVAGCGLALNISELRVADAKLKALAQRVVESQEQERARLSRDLHDGISQWLVSIKLQVEAGLARLGGNAEQQTQARAGFEHTADQLTGVLGEVRRISHDLRPALLDDIGLAAALDHLAHEFSQTSAAPARFTQEGSIDGLPQVANTVLFRIAQEALTNIERHAEASRIDIRLSSDGRTVTLSIADDGVGFDAAGVAVHPQRGIGLRNMHERVDAIGGRLLITSSPAGTTVQASVDLDGWPAAQLDGRGKGGVRGAA